MNISPMEANVNRGFNEKIAFVSISTLPETNIVNINCWKMTFPFGAFRPISRH